MERSRSAATALRASNARAATPTARAEEPAPGAVRRARAPRAPVRPTTIASPACAVTATKGAALGRRPRAIAAAAEQRWSVEQLFCLGEDEDQGQPGNCRTIDEAFSRGAGEPCLVDAPLCQAALRCVIEGVDTTTGSITARCGSPVASGAACKIAIPDMCQSGEYCAVAANALDGTCTRKPGAGSPCIARGNDPPEICAPGTRCDGGQCRPRQKLGGSCQADAVCYSDHCSGGSCASAGACE